MKNQQNSPLRSQADTQLKEENNIPLVDKLIQKALEQLK